MKKPTSLWLLSLFVLGAGFFLHTQNNERKTPAKGVFSSSSQEDHQNTMVMRDHLNTTSNLDNIEKLYFNLNNLAGIHKSRGQYAQVEPLYKRSLEVNEKAFGPEHPAVATSLNNMATLYCTQGWHSQAEPLFKRSLAMKEKILGAEHPSIATSLEGMARLFRKTSRKEEAGVLEKRAATIMAISDKKSMQ